MTRSIRLFAFLVPVFLLGCAGNPETLSSGDRSIQPSQAVREPKTLDGRVMEWGGLLIGAYNLKDRTELEILGFPLEANGRPLRDADPTGRFIAVRAGYLETAEYTAGRLITVVGPIKRIRDGQIDKARYRYPELEIRELYLWPNTSSRTSPDVRFGIGAGSWGGNVGVGIGF